MIYCRATSKTLTWTLKYPDPEKPGPWNKIRPEKHGINMGLKNRSAFREFNKENVQCDL